MGIGVTKSNRRFSEPAYARIQQDMRRRIRDGKWRPGEMLPGRLDLSREYSVSLVTLQRAVADLLDDGTLNADSRKGTYVSESAIEIIEREGVDFGDTVQEDVPFDKAVGTLAIVTSVGNVLAETFVNGHFWLTSIIQAAEETFSAAGGSVIVLNRCQGGNKITISDAFHQVQDKGATAIAWIELNPIGHEIGEALSKIDPDVFPFVCTSGDEIMAPVPHISYDSRLAGYEAASHLIKQGCKEIVFFTPFSATWSAERLLGVREAMQHANLSDDSLLIFPDASEQSSKLRDFTANATYCGRIAFSRGLIKDGVVAENDEVAHGFMNAGIETGHTAGRDYAIVGFDDISLSVLYGLSTMRPPLEAMGREAALSILNLIHGQKPAGHVRLRSRLIARSSTSFRR